MRLQSSYARHVPWADEETANFGESQGPQGRGRGPAEPARGRKLRARRHAPITLTAGLLFVAGLGAGGLMFSDRLTDLVRGHAWVEPSAGWMALFNEKGGL